MSKISLGLALIGLVLFLLDEASAEDGEPEWTFDSEKPLGTVDISQDGKFLAAGGSDHNIYFFNQHSSVPLWNYTTGGDVHSVALSVDGQYLVAGSSDHKVYFFDTAFSEPVWEHRTDDIIYSVDLSASGEHIVAGGRDGRVYTYERQDSSPLTNFSTDEVVWSVAISADGEYFASGTDGNDPYLDFFGWGSWSPQWRFKANSDVLLLTLSDTGSFLFAGAGSRTYFFNTTSDEPLWKFESSYGFDSLDLQPTGSFMLASGSTGSNNWTYLLNATSNQPMATLNTYHQTKSVAMSRFEGNKGYLVTGNGSGHVGLWRQTGLDVPEFLWSHDMGQDVEGVSISDDGRYLAAINRDGRLSLFYNDDSQVPNQVPRAIIQHSTPSDRQVGKLVTFYGNGTDEDGAIINFFWNSSLQGFLGDSPIFSLANLELGHHNISLQVQDDLGGWSRPVYHQLWVYDSLTIEELDPVLVLRPREGDPTNSTAWFGLRVANTGANLNLFSARLDDPPHENLTLDLYLETRLNDSFHWPATGQVLEASKSILCYLAATVTGPMAPGQYPLGVEFTDLGEGVTKRLELVLGLDLPEVSAQVIAPLQAHEFEPVTFSGSGRAPGSTITAYHWRSSLAGTLSTEGNWSSSNLTPGLHSIGLRVQRVDGVWSFWNYSHLFINGRPVASIHPLQQQSLLAGDNVTFHGEARDLEDHLAVMRWWSSLDGEFGDELNSTLHNISQGNHTIYFQVQDPLGAWSEPAWLNLTVMARARPSPGTAQDDPLTSNPWFLLLLLSLLMAGTGTGTLRSNENWRYQFWLLLGPYMARRRERKAEDPLANRIRNLIHSYIQVYPGSHYSQIKDRLSLINGTLAYHLNVLEKQRLVDSHKRGRLRCYYPRGETPDDLHELPVSAGQTQIMDLIREHPGISQKSLALSLGVTGAAIKYHVDGLIQRGQVRRERNGLSVAYFVDAPQGKS